MDGILLVNKEKNCTSHDVVYKIKKMLNVKVGHTGTLDPMATGVLPLLIGKGTLCSKYLINHDKIYKVKLQLGEKTATADAEGEIIEKREVKIETLKEEYVEEVFKNFIGKQKQIPPIYSAIKVNGKKLYEYARKGQEVKIEPRNIEIYKIELININKELKQIDFIVHCSKGTYIRSLCEDIASKLDTVGFMKELERLQVGEFNLSNTLTVSQVEKNLQNLEKSNSFITIEKIFENYPSIKLQDTKKFLNGVKLNLKKEDGVYKIYNLDSFIGTGIVKDDKLKRDVIC